MTQFFSLPDYTFEEVCVPSWAFPVLDDEDLLPTPRPRGHAKEKAADALTAPPRFPVPIGAFDFDAMEQPGEERPVQSGRGGGVSPRANGPSISFPKTRIQ